MKTQENYKSIANKYRPSNLKELKAQDAMIKILSRAIQSGNVAQSYLLTGIRGVGKTSTARIIAKTLSCTDLALDEGVPLVCGECSNCKSFISRSHPDIYEMDAASKTGVDDVREILESAEYKPLVGRYKIFIIDEVHMLSKGAFNAMLKILEEPPPHAIFIFATTEVQKVPLTILSRCQRYDLRRFSFDEVFTLLKNIIFKEGIRCSDEVPALIAYKSEGSARDAITMLEQLSHFSSNPSESINLEDAERILGSVSVSKTLAFLKSVFSGEVEAALIIISELHEGSVHLDRFIESVSEMLSYACKLKLLPKDFTLPLYVTIDPEIRDLIKDIEFSKLSILWQIYHDSLASISLSRNLLLFCEMTVLKSIYACNLPKIEELARFSDLPRR
jgi:DNA polymerase-3 subunit gamma/tau